ncbi:MAG: CHRD domain-containing protein [Opitutaceae bacterium]|nr:CHRD domain-containing protein [Opitutaceae bacterium]
MNLPKILAGVAVAALGLPLAAVAQKVILTAEITASQEVPATTSPAIGEAVMKYDMDTNTFDLEVRIKGLAEDITASHIHEADAGANGSPVVNLGDESAYKRSGERVRLKVKRGQYAGDVGMLLTGGAYLNFHTATFPAGAIRGQLLPHSADFIANLKPVGAANAGGPRARGVARVRYSFLDDTIDARVVLSNFRNTLTGVFIRLDGASAGGITEVALGQPSDYRRRGKTYHGDLSGIEVPPPVEGDDADFLLAMLDGRTSVVATSEVYPEGETKGQLRFLHSKRGRR